MRSRYSLSQNTRLPASNLDSNSISIPDLTAHMATYGLTRGPDEEILALGALELHISTLLSLVSCRLHFSYSPVPQLKPVHENQVQTQI